MKISKLDASRRQILAAIHLHWFLVEPLAVYQLAANASEVCDAILEKLGQTRIKQHIADMQGWHTRDVNILINGPRNYLKHADRDYLERLEDITFEECSALILTACVDYSIAAKRSPEIVGTFIAWFAATNPEKTGSFFSDAANQIFPDLAKVDRAAQISAARNYCFKPSRQDVLHDVRNELSDNWRWADLRRAGQTFRVE